jgi:hypothetical protein
LFSSCKRIVFLVLVNFKAHQLVESRSKEQKFLTPFAIIALMSKSKMPPQLLAHFKEKGEKNKDGSEMSDKDKRKAALDKARKYQKQKKEDKK